MILSLTGIVDGAGRLEEAAGRLLRCSRRPLIIDLSGVWGWTDAGQRALATAAGRPARAGTVVLCSMPGHLRITDRRLTALPRYRTRISALTAQRRRAEAAQTLRAATPVGPDAAPMRHAACTLAAESRSVGLARHWAQGTLTGWGLPTAADQAGLPVSEMVTNALLHGRVARLLVSVELWQARDGRRLPVVSVQDSSPHPPMLGGPDDGRPGGWGIPLLLAATDTCGWHPRHDGPGKIVWFTCTPDQPPTSRR